MHQGLWLGRSQRTTPDPKGTNLRCSQQEVGISANPTGTQGLLTEQIWGRGVSGPAFRLWDW